ncbi:hypothetical protein LEP1GSC062_2004 [Leptospira alexanderi serovar Manhao 3 str. L 60]|uniref:Uncharacterized protein n=1 Tax=Leptospira alexanderi serovar Manhao 3 str. L 60 TaxID=1049759 RepID=V6HY95_9LEPT|nr:hypothetical protein LEP1GSC062_2004 [Leptospira alexanderi serovar Manhao 3 str. L 60]
MFFLREFLVVILKSSLENNDSKNLLQSLPDVAFSDFFLNLNSRIVVLDKFGATSFPRIVGFF